MGGGGGGGEAGAGGATRLEQWWRRRWRRCWLSGAATHERRPLGSRAERVLGRHPWRRCEGGRFRRARAYLCQRFDGRETGGVVA